LSLVMTLTSMKGFRSWDLDATPAFCVSAAAGGRNGIH
jgi:hypothetical protein